MYILTVLYILFYLVWAGLVLSRRGDATMCWLIYDNGGLVDLIRLMGMTYRLTVCSIVCFERYNESGVLEFGYHV